MSYFLINGNDYSMYCNGLKVKNSVNYNAQTNAAGDTVVDYINKKRTFEVGIIPLDSEVMTNLLNDINAFNVQLSFRNPNTNTIEAGVNCIIPASEIEYYTIQADKVSYKAFTLNFIEL